MQAVQQSKVLRKVKTFLGLSPYVILWLFPTTILMGLAAFLVWRFSTQRITGFLGQDCGVNAWISLSNDRQSARAFAVFQTVGIVSRYAPWRSNCYPQAIVARWLLYVHRVPHNVFFGVAKAKDQTLSAHAWVCAGPNILGGTRSFERFSVVRNFASAPAIV